MIELIEKLKESTKKPNKRKRHLTRTFYRRSKKKGREIFVRKSSSVLRILEEKETVSDTDLSLRNDSEPSTTFKRQTDEADDEIKVKGCRTPMNNLNMTVMTVKVIRKSPITTYGNYIRKQRIAMLLHCDAHLEYIRSSAFGNNVQYINQIMKTGMSYNISGYELRESDYLSPDQVLILSQSTIIKLVSKDKRLESTKHHKIADIKDKTLVRKLRTVGPVIITSVGPVRKPSKKYLKEVMLKDESGKIKMNIWGFERDDIQFWYKRGDVLELQYVEVGLFKSYDADEFHLTSGDFVSYERQPLEEMQHLLKHEDEHYLTPEMIEIKDVVKLKRSKYLIYIRSIKIESFRKSSHVKMIIKHCDIGENHGMLIKTDKGWYCEECQECQVGEDKIRLIAEIVDYPINSNKSLMVTLFDKSAETILGTKYESFRESNAKKRKAILKKVEKQDTVFRLEIRYNPKFDFQIATKIEILSKKKSL